MIVTVICNARTQQYIRLHVTCFIAEHHNYSIIHYRKFAYQVYAKNICLSTVQVLSKKSRRQKKAAKRIEEEELYQKEHSLLEVDKAPESADDFDRLLVASPNSSALWVQYMAFYLHAAEIDKARNIAQRALSTISFRYTIL